MDQSGDDDGTRGRDWTSDPERDVGDALVMPSRSYGCRQGDVVQACEEIEERRRAAAGRPQLDASARRDVKASKRLEALEGVGRSWQTRKQE